MSSSCTISLFYFLRQHLLAVFLFAGICFSRSRAECSLSAVPTESSHCPTETSSSRPIAWSLVPSMPRPSWRQTLGKTSPWMQTKLLALWNVGLKAWVWVQLPSVLLLTPLHNCTFLEVLVFTLISSIPESIPLYAWHPLPVQPLALSKQGFAILADNHGQLLIMFVITTTISNYPYQEYHLYWLHLIPQDSEKNTLEEKIGAQKHHRKLITNNSQTVVGLQVWPVNHR